ncbi:hypothetical protein [Methyloglobulus sp.]|uniref:hypothetical protein n=1 Tax=Methyloglobulus sp. TaxID=2518622 RepID=UPI003988F72E
MRFIRTGALVKPFNFSIGQREIIISKFSKEYQEHRLVSINGFLIKAESIIEFWYDLPHQNMTPLPDYKERLKEINTTTIQLLKQLERLPEDCCELLNAESMAALHYHSEQFDIHDIIENLTGTTPKLLSLEQLEPLLIECLKVLEASTSTCLTKASNPAKPGVDRTKVKLLVKYLIEAYYQQFAEKITYSKESNFFVAVSKGIAKVLDVEIGYKLINEVLVNTPFKEKFE